MYFVYRCYKPFNPLFSIFFQTYKLSNTKISTLCIHSRGAHSWSQWWRFQQYDWRSWQRSISCPHLTHIQCISYTVKIRLGTEVIDIEEAVSYICSKKTQEPFVNGWQRRRGVIHLLKKDTGALYKRMTRWRRQNIELWEIPQASNMVSCLISENAWMNGTCGLQPCCNSPPNRRPAVFWVFDQSGVEGNVTILVKVQNWSKNWKEFETKSESFQSFHWSVIALFASYVYNFLQH